jgi:two-component system response regulator DesR
MAAAGLPVTGGSRVTIRLLIADDQELFRSALAALLALQEDFEVVASVGRGDEVAAAARDHHPDIALLDIDMPGIDGLAAAAVLAQEVPRCRSLILTTFGRPGYLRRAMESGAYGFIVKDAPAEQLADAIRRVMAGERVVDPALAAATLAGGISPLTARNATCWPPPAPARPWPTSRANWSCPKGPSATTCRPPWPRSGRATAPKPSASPTNGAGCKELRQHTD